MPKLFCLLIISWTLWTKFQNWIQSGTVDAAASSLYYVVRKVYRSFVASTYIYHFPRCMNVTNRKVAGRVIGLHLLSYLRGTNPLWRHNTWKVTHRNASTNGSSSNGFLITGGSASMTFSPWIFSSSLTIVVTWQIWLSETNRIYISLLGSATWVSLFTLWEFSNIL